MIRSLIILSLLASACRSRTDSELRVSNPIPAGDSFPEVVELAVRSLNGRIGNCSGVFIKPRLLLTAAHCTYSKEGKGMASISYKDTDGVVHQGKMFPARKYRRFDDDRFQYDVALISFDKDVAPAIARRAPTMPISGDVMTIVGFGISDMDKADNGTKRLGYNRIRSSKGNLLVMKGLILEQQSYPPGQASLFMPGDSGSGMFNERSELSGINVAGWDKNQTDKFGNIIWESNSVNLAHPKVKSLLKGIETDFCAGKNLQPGESCPRDGICGIQ